MVILLNDAQMSRLENFSGIKILTLGLRIDQSGATDFVN